VRSTGRVAQRQDSAPSAIIACRALIDDYSTASPFGDGIKGGEDPMSDDLISVIDVALELGKRKAAIFKIMKRLGIEARKRRLTSRGNQLVSYITQSDLERVRGEVLSTRRRRRADEIIEDGDDDYISAELGVFYLVRLEPNHDPGRFKTGFAANMPERLRALRCSAPFATVVKSWACRRLWERTAIDCVTTGCEQIHTEVFRTDSLEGVQRKCEEFFGMMPDPATVSRPAEADGSGSR
jgi:hypothetical protein